MCAASEREEFLAPAPASAPAFVPRNSKESRKLEREFFGADYCDVAETPIPPSPVPATLAACALRTHTRVLLRLEICNVWYNEGKKCIYFSRDSFRREESCMYDAVDFS